MKTYLPVLLLLLLLPMSARGQSVLYSETFDTTPLGSIPGQWSATGPGWEVDDGSSGPGSGANNLMHKGSDPAMIETRSLDLSSVTSASLHYLARRTGTYGQDALVLTASTDGGATYPITLLAANAALPVETSSYDSMGVVLPPGLLGQADVRFRFEASGGSQSTSSIRIDDLQLTGSGSIPQNIFGFNAASASVLEETALFDVPLSLSLIAAEGLQGLQFTMISDNDAVQFIGLQRGTAISNTSDWHVSFTTTGDTLKAVVLGADQNALPPASYDPILTVQIATGSVDQDEDVELSLTGVIGALGTPTGDDADLLVGPASFALTVQDRIATFSPSVSSLDFGTIPAGSSASLQFDVTNAGGTTDLIISNSSIDHALFSIDPATATITPDAGQTFTVTFTAPEDSSGSQSATLTMTHNGEEDNGESTIALTGEIEPLTTRGDANEDGVVNVVDLVLAIDFLLDRATPSQAQFANVDLAPFPNGDGSLDVRDLTVLAQAISLDQWPDGSSVASGSAFSKTQTASDSDVRLRLLISEEDMTVKLENDLPLRAVQFVFRVEGISDAVHLKKTASLADGSTVLLNYQTTNQALSVLLYRMDGGKVHSGRHDLAVLNKAGIQPEQITLVEALAVQENLDAVEVDTRIESTYEQRNADSFSLDPSYPHPFRLEHHAEVRIPVRIAEEELVMGRIYDTLGRRIRQLTELQSNGGVFELIWDGRTDRGSRVAPGVYVLRIEGSHRFMQQPIVVIR